MGSFYVKSVRKLDPCPPSWRDPQLDLEIGFQKKNNPRTSRNFTRFFQNPINTNM